MIPFAPLILVVFTLSIHLLTQQIGFNRTQWDYLTRVRLIIPRLDMIAPVTRFTLGAETWEIAPWETRVGHFSGTSWLSSHDSSGNIVIGGHAEYPDGTPAVFAELDKLRIHDTVTLHFGGLPYRYRVTEMRYVAQDDLTVLYPTTQDQLTLITCDEVSYDPVSKTYAKRLVIIAIRVDE
jgi:LPXTG-site transpeptidase (sortase) family protein